MTAEPVLELRAPKHASARFGPNRAARRASRPARRGHSACSRASACSTRGYDSRPGLLFLNNRHHDPTLGTFISVDPLVVQTGEAYQYGSANPITLSDPTGLCSMMDPNVEACYAALQQAASLVPFVYTNSDGDAEVTVMVDPGVPLEQGLLSHWDADWEGTQWEREVFFEGASQSHGHMAAESSEVARNRDLTERILSDLDAWGQGGALKYESDKMLMEGLTAWGFLRLAAPKSPAGVRSGASGGTAGEKLLANRVVGVDSRLLGHSFARGSTGVLNRVGARVKFGWTSSGEFGGGFHLRLGIGRNAANPSQAAFHLDFRFSHVPNSVANDVISAIRTARGLQ